MDKNINIRRLRGDAAVGYLDIFEVVTPEGISRRVKALDAAWQTLKPLAYIPIVKAELAAWSKWRDEILKTSGTLFFGERSWGTGVMKELDKWELRYKDTFEKAGNPKNSPSPAVFIAGEGGGFSSYFMAFLAGAFIGAILLSKIGGKS